MEQKLADQGASLADDKKEALQKSYQEKAIAFKRFQDDAQRQLEEAQKKELEELQKRVLPVISQIGKEKGYTLIFNKFQSGSRLRRRRRGRHRRSAEALQHDVAMPAPAAAPARAGAPQPRTGRRRAAQAHAEEAFVGPRRPRPSGADPPGRPRTSTIRPGEGGQDEAVRRSAGPGRRARTARSRSGDVARAVGGRVAGDAGLRSLGSAGPRRGRSRAPFLRRGRAGAPRTRESRAGALLAPSAEAAAGKPAVIVPEPARARWPPGSRSCIRPAAAETRGRLRRPRAPDGAPRPRRLGGGRGHHRRRAPGSGRARSSGSGAFVGADVEIGEDGVPARQRVVYGGCRDRRPLRSARRSRHRLGRVRLRLGRRAPPQDSPGRHRAAGGRRRGGRQRRDRPRDARRDGRRPRHEDRQPRPGRAQRRDRRALASLRAGRRGRLDADRAARHAGRDRRASRTTPRIGDGAIATAQSGIVHGRDGRSRGRGLRDAGGAAPGVPEARGLGGAAAGARAARRGARAEAGRRPAKEGARGARNRRDPEDPAAPVPVSARGPDPRARGGQARRRDQERDLQRGVLPGALPRQPRDAGRADRRGDGAGGRCRPARHGARSGEEAALHGRRRPRAGSAARSCRATSCAWRPRSCRSGCGPASAARGRSSTECSAPRRS